MLGDWLAKRADKRDDISRLNVASAGNKNNCALLASWQPLAMGRENDIRGFSPVDSDTSGRNIR